MEVKKGYKKTEVGIIPSDWKILRLGDVCVKIGSGITPEGGEKYYLSEGHPFIRSQNVGWGSLQLEDVAFIGSEVHLTFSSTEIKLDDVLLNITGASIGRTAIADKRVVGGNVNQHVCIIRTQSNILFPVFLKYFLLSKLGQKQIDSYQTGGNRQGLNFGQIKNFYIPAPSKIFEQKAIASSLMELDQIIEGTQFLIRKKEFILEGTIQKLFKPNESWITKKIKNIGKLTSSGVDKTINSEEKEIRLLNYLDVFHKNFIYSRTINHWVTANKEKIMQCSISKGDIFFTPSSEMRYDIAISAVAMENISDAVYSYHLYRLRLFYNWDLKFRCYIFRTRFFLNQAEKTCEGSGKRYVISLSKFNEINICFPENIKEQEKIGNILYDIEGEITLLNSKLEKYQQIKDGLLQNLLTGKTKLI